MERADVPQGTTDVTEGILPQITIIDREIASTSVVPIQRTEFKLHVF
jgi:hypothetical protein